MADSNSSSANSNSWTILQPEVKEVGVESVGPLAEGREGPGHSEPAQLDTEQPDTTDLSQRSEFTDGPSEHDSAPEPPQVTPLETSEDGAFPITSHQKEHTLNASPVENLTCLTSDPELQSSSAAHSESEPFLSPDTYSFSDSFTHISPPPPSTLLHTGSKNEEVPSQGEELKKHREESTADVEVSEENEGDGVRRRKVSPLSPVDHRDEEEEEEEDEEPFRPPQRENDFGFSLNKCIFGAFILLGLGTIFFSEGDADVQELKNPELPKEWLNLEASKDAPASVQPPEALERLAKESQQIAVLQAQLQEQEQELKAAQLQVEEGTKERLRREDLEVENQRMRGELEKLPALQKELEQESERVKQDLEAVPVLQKELELLKAKVTELAQSSDGVQAATPLSASVTPSAGQETELPASQGRKELKDKKSKEKVKEGKEQKNELKQRKESKKDKSVKEEKPQKEKDGEGKEEKKQKQKEREKKTHQDEGKEWKAKGERKAWKDEKEVKKGKKQDNGKRWKDDESKREFKDEGRKKEGKEDGKQRKDGAAKREFKEERGKEDKKWKTENHWQLDDVQWETKERKHSGDKRKEDKEWKLGKAGTDKHEKEWKKDRQVDSNGKQEWKEKNERKKDWKERDEWDSENERRNRNGEGKFRKQNAFKDEKEHYKESDGKKEWKKDRQVDSNGKQEWKGKNERKKDWKEQDEWDSENGRRNRNGERKARKENAWNDEKEHSKGSGGKKEWKKDRQVDSNDNQEWKEKNERKKDGKERDEWDSENERRNRNSERKAWKENAGKDEKDHYEGNDGKKEWKEREDKHPSWKKDGEGAEEKKHKGDYQKSGEKWNKKEKLGQNSEKVHHHLYSDRKQSQDHMHVDYWTEQRERIRHYHGSTEGCGDVTSCAHADGLTPVAQRDFETLLSAYMTKLPDPEDQPSKKDDLKKLIDEFFTDGVYVHDQIPFGEFVEDVADILEDMAEGEDDELEDEMEGFAKEAMEKFVLPERGGNEEKRREGLRKRASG